MHPGQSIEEVLAVFRQEVDSEVEKLARDFYESVALEPAASARGPFLDAVQGGKRFRALCALIGAAVGIAENRAQESGSELLASVKDDQRVLGLATALELYQASALVHDDLLDDSDTRRGRATPHVLFEDQHKELGLWGDSSDYGRDGAVLLGDLLMSAADFALATTLAEYGSDQAGHLALRFSLMTGEVALGQWAETLVSYTPILAAAADRNDVVEDTLAVVASKSGRYSVMHPAVLGALAVGASKQTQEMLERILEPAGIAFQLRDDALGVFGKPGILGKPVSTDIAEKKRTVLLALALQQAPEHVAKRLSGLYEQDELTEAQVDEVREILAQYGSTQHEALIETISTRALSVLEQADLPAAAKDLLSHLVDLVTVRDA